MDISILGVSIFMGVIQIVVIFSILQINTKVGELHKKTAEELETLKSIHRSLDQLRIELKRRNDK